MSWQGLWELDGRGWEAVYLRGWSQLTRLGLFRAAGSANQTMQIYGKNCSSRWLHKICSTLFTFFDSIYNIYIYWHNIDVRYSIMYMYIYILLQLNTSEGSKKVGFGVVPYIYIWVVGYIPLNHFFWRIFQQINHPATGVPARKVWRKIRVPVLVQLCREAVKESGPMQMIQGFHWFHGTNKKSEKSLPVGGWKSAKPLGFAESMMS